MFEYWCLDSLDYMLLFDENMLFYVGVGYLWFIVFLVWVDWCVLC